MNMFRRSVKGDKSENKPHHISITPKSAIAIVPPKRVIKALYDYDPDPSNTQELGFAKGDFFHVISRENDDDWYEACNPLIPNARGLVPVSYFEVIGKTERQSAGSAASGASNTIPLHDSGYSEKPSQHLRHESNAGARGHNRISSMGRGSGAMVYGVVQYDFNAERPDELDAKQGEYIIVIAQSNPEWFVAKPIGRLGGPGLIPVAFIEIKNMATGETVTDVQGAIARAGVPKVEEWKKMAADYKNSSITLGKFEVSNPASAQRDLERMSLSNSSQHQTNGNGSPFAQNQPYHQRNASRATQNGNNRQSQRTLCAPVSASVPRYCFENDKYWYIIECQLEDGRHWELSRYYQNFYDFQIALLQEFPKEADSNGGTRILPYMPGPVTYVTDAISNGRRESLDDYVRKLLALPPYISKCQLVRELFAPREGDYELDPRAAGEDYRLSNGSQQSSIADSLSRTTSRQSSRGQMNGSAGRGPGSMAPPQQRNGHQRSQPSVSGASGAPPGQQQYRNQADYHQQAPINRQPSNLTDASATSSGTHRSNPGNQAPSASATNVAATGAMRFKIWFGDECRAIRVPTELSFLQLKEKVRDRFGLEEEIMIQYRDESSGNLVAMFSDRDLDQALTRNPKLTFYTQYV
ncbi:bud emergence protein 1 [Xanthoria parietina]